MRSHSLLQIFPTQGSNPVLLHCKQILYHPGHQESQGWGGSVSSPHSGCRARAAKVLSWPTLCDPMDCTRQDPLSMEFSRQEYWSGLPFPFPGGPEGLLAIPWATRGLFIKGLHIAHCLAGTWKRTREGYLERCPGYTTVAQDLGQTAFESLKSHLPKNRTFWKNSVVSSLLL